MLSRSRLTGEQLEYLEQGMRILARGSIFYLSSSVLRLGRDSGNMLCYNSVVVPPSWSHNRLANGKPSITISSLFRRLGSERELDRSNNGLLWLRSITCSRTFTHISKAVDALLCQRLLIKEP